MKQKFFKFSNTHPAVVITFFSVYFLSSLLIFYFTYIGYWNLNWGLFPFQFDSQGYGLIVTFLFSFIIYFAVSTIFVFCLFAIALILLTDLTLEKLFDRVGRRYEKQITSEKKSQLLFFFIVVGLICFPVTIKSIATSSAKNTDKAFKYDQTIEMINEADNLVNVSIIMTSGNAIAVKQKDGSVLEIKNGTWKSIVSKHSE